MNAKPALAPPRVAATLVVAALAALIGIGLPAAVASLLQSNGMPFEQIVVAERACASHPFVSERETCMRAYLVASRPQTIASR